VRVQHYFWFIADHAASAVSIGRLLGCWNCHHEVVCFNVTRGNCVPVPTQRAIFPGSINEY